jgi:hypothetical protein
MCWWGGNREQEEPGDSHEFTTYRFLFTRTIVQHLRPRTWFVVVASENCTRIPPIQYELTFFNLHKNHFGVNQYGINALYGTFAFLYALLLGLQLRSRRMWTEYHYLPRLVTASVAFATAGAAVLTMHWSVFGVDGVGVPFLWFGGLCLLLVAKLVLLAVLLLLAQGWTILRGEVQRRALLVGVLGGWFWFELLLLVWANVPVSSQTEEDGGFVASLGRDPASVDSLYDLTAGKILLLLDLAVACWFVYSILRTTRNPLTGLSTGQRNNQRRFMIHLLLVFGTYLSFAPLLVAILGKHLDPWVCEKVVLVVQTVLDFAASALLCYLIWPTFAEEHFVISGTFEVARAREDPHHAIALEERTRLGGGGISRSSGSGSSIDERPRMRPMVAGV